MLIMPIIVITVVVGIITLLSVMISKKSFQEMEKMSPIECGMMMMSSPRPPFSLQFFLLAILFLIFDVEIALILPLPLITPYSMSMLMISASIFLLILILGILYEWINGALEWNH